MTREIKFRAWARRYHKMVDVTVNLHGFLDDKEYIVMQYTGLLDKNGKEIYERDIVKWGHVVGGEEKPIRIAIVEMHPDIFFRNIADGYEFHYAKFAYQDTHNWLEVIGNIYEHGHLLNENR